MIGKILNGRYQIIRQLGKGGFGETYLAKDQWLDDDNQCVVKRLKPDAINAVTLRLFETEAQILTKLGSHDQIPKLLAHFQENQEFYLIQEFIDGHDLTQEIRINYLWSETEVIKLLEEILAILEFVHQQNPSVIHRDIKPANIMRRHQDGKIMLIDFGGVKRVKIEGGGSTILTPVVGTQGYTPDEQWKNKAQLCSDIYAVGIVAIEALTGLHPRQIFRNHETGQLQWRDRARVSKGLADVLDKMVQFHFSERYQSATEALEAVKSLTFTALYWFDRGDKLVELKDYEDGIAAYNQAIKINPNYYQAIYHRGIALRQLQRYEEAIASFEQAIQTNPDIYQAWYSRGLLLEELSKYKEAIDYFEQVTKIKPDYYQAWYHLGLAFEKLGKYKEAINCFDQVTKIQPNYYQAWYNRGLILKELGKYEEAINSFKQALQIQPYNIEILYEQGLALNKVKKLEQALESFNQIIKIQTYNAEAWYSQGILLNKLQRHSEALVSFEQAVSINPKFQLAIRERNFTQKVLQMPRFLRWLWL